MEDYTPEQLDRYRILREEKEKESYLPDVRGLATQLNYSRYRNSYALEKIRVRDPLNHKCVRVLYKTPRAKGLRRGKLNENSF